MATGAALVEIEEHVIDVNADTVENLITGADLVLDGVSEEEVWRYYSTKWKKSELIRDAYEAEEYFKRIGEDGKWLFFTAAPLTDPDGTVVGAIETLWDNTENQRADVERRNYTRRIEESERTLSQIIQGSTIPTFVIDRDHVHAGADLPERLDRILHRTDAVQIGADRDHLDPAFLEARSDSVPAPGTVPGAVDKQDWRLLWRTLRFFRQNFQFHGTSSNVSLSF